MVTKILPNIFKMFDPLQQFFHHPPALDVGVVIREAYRMQETTPPEIHPERLLGSLVPLTRGTYPVFNKYPKFIVDYQAREREKIRRDEEDYLRQRYTQYGYREGVFC